jgi:hypothetical protein
MIELANCYLTNRFSDFITIASLMSAQEMHYYGSRGKARFIINNIKFNDAIQVDLCRTFTAIHNKKQVRDTFDELGLDGLMLNDVHLGAIESYERRCNRM